MVNGKEVKERTVYNGKPLMPGDTQRMFMDDEGKSYLREEISFIYEGEAVQEISQTKVFSITEFAPLSDYTDKYVIDKYYELMPDDNGMTKDFDREQAIKGNLVQMRRLWEYLHSNKVVARAEFNISSRGFVASDGYIRAIEFDKSKWGLEIGVFKEAKVFMHLEEQVPDSDELIASPQKSRKTIRRV